MKTTTRATLPAPTLLPSAPHRRAGRTAASHGPERRRKSRRAIAYRTGGSVACPTIPFDDTDAVLGFETSALVDPDFDDLEPPHELDQVARMISSLAAEETHWEEI